MGNNPLSKKRRICLKLFIFVGIMFVFLLPGIKSAKLRQKEAIRLQEFEEREGPKLQQSEIQQSGYSIFDEDIYDAPTKTQVTLKVLVSGKTSESQLRNLLTELYSSTKAKTGFKYHTSPTSIYIYVFTSKEHAEVEMGQWIAMLQKSHMDTEPTITINEGRIAQLGVKPEEKFGLSEEKRKQIWSEIVRSEDRASKESEEIYSYPSDSTGYSEFLKEGLNKQTQLRNKLNEKYKNEIAGKYGLTREQIDKIAEEGLAKNWPFPRYE